MFAFFPLESFLPIEAELVPLLKSHPAVLQEPVQSLLSRWETATGDDISLRSPRDSIHSLLRPHEMPRAALGILARKRSVRSIPSKLGFAQHGFPLCLASIADYAFSLRSIGGLFFAHLYALRSDDDAVRRRRARCRQSASRELRRGAAFGFHGGQ